MAAAHEWYPIKLFQLAIDTILIPKMDFFLSLYLYPKHSSIPKKRKWKAYSGAQEPWKIQFLQQDALPSFWLTVIALAW